MGTCITVIKVIGAGSLGITTAALSYTSIKRIPDLTRASESYSVEQFTVSVKNLIIQTRSAVLAFGSIATTSLLLAYRSSAIRGKHPYLIYAALGFPLTLVTYFYRAYSTETELLNLSPSAKAQSSGSKEVKSKKTKEHLESTLDNSVYQDLGRTSSQEETEDDENVETEINSVIIKKESNFKLNKLQLAYEFSGAFVGLAAVIATIGLIGDKY